jgi:hypothetical protein
MRPQPSCLLLLALCLTSCLPKEATLLPGQPGRYEGVVQAQWLDDGRQMKLLEKFAYVDGDGKRWEAKKDAVIDGASIPRALWWAGGPYEGKYRDASVVHDVYCDELPKTAEWQAVHRMFYQAMLASGVEKARALVMFAAVYRFGPKWDTACMEATARTNPACIPPPPPPPPPGVDASASIPPPPDAEVENDAKQIRAQVERGEITTPEQIEAMGRVR